MNTFDESDCQGDSNFTVAMEEGCRFISGLIGAQYTQLTNLTNCRDRAFQLSYL